MEQGSTAEIRSLEAPTGLGKTLATLVGWLWDRQQRPQITPRRLVYQLPLRTLTEQIAIECRAVMGRLGVSIPVYVLRGGQIDIDAELVNDLEAGLGWIDPSGLPLVPEPEETLPWLPPDYLAGLLLNQWHFDAHVPIKGDRDRWQQLLSSLAAPQRPWRWRCTACALPMW